jgi:hypothetical protein
MKVISYVATLPSKLLSRPHDTDHKFLTLTGFAQGVSTFGDAGLIEYSMNYQPSEVAFMLGWVHEHGKRSPHLIFRKNILDQQTVTGGRTIIADSNLFLYKNIKNPKTYQRYSYDGVFPNTGEYCDQDPDPARWQQIKQDIGLDLQPWRKQGNHLLVCLQRNGGWSMSGISTVDWAMQTIRTLRQYSTRPIRVRSHPGDKGAGIDCARILKLCAIAGLDQVGLSQPGSDLVSDLHNCWAVINHNSSPAVGAAIEGIPVFVTDLANSQCADIANGDLKNIENPDMPDRQAWVERLAQFHWCHEELVNGTCWQHMKKWAKK